MRLRYLPWHFGIIARLRCEHEESMAIEQSQLFRIIYQWRCLQ
jgi:hypothetical protein